MAFPALVAGGLAAVLMRVLSAVLIAKGAAIVMRTMGVLGLAFVTYEMIIEPLLNHVSSGFSSLPPELAVWISALGIDRVVSIVASAYVILMTKRVVLGRKS